MLCVALGLSAIYSPGLAQGLNAEETNKLKLIEQNLFFKNYDDDTAEVRMARIEKRVFGEAAEGALSTRMANILQVAKPLEKAPTQRQGNATQNSGGGSNSPRNAQPTFEQQQQDQQMRQEDAADRARQRAMAARDEEVNQMFADAV
ncbi:MAG: hypothetical protein WCT03_26180, partial [Candidatus Obscuribacterales bacterium]